MFRALVVMFVLLVIGCGPDALHISELAPIAAPHIEIENPATFAAWPSMTPKPVGVTLILSADCTYTGSTTINSGTLRLDDSSEPSPHDTHSIVVRVNPEAASAYREGRPLPAGAVVIKEKYDNPIGSGPLKAYAAMIKHNPGFDPDNGDWEYAFVTLSPDRLVKRGKIASCAACHAAAKETDFLFRTDGKTIR